MSYILEALKRAERERHVGRTPTVETLAQAAAPPPARWRPSRSQWLATASLLIAAAAALILWLRTPQATVDAGPPAASPATSARPATVSASVAETETEAAPPPTEAALEDASAVSSLDDLVDGDDRDDVEVAPAASASASESERAASHRRIAALQPQDLAEPPSTSAVDADVPAAGPSGTTPEARPLREMPDAYRARFPVHGLDVHVYDPDPARRWIMIAGKRYREGQVVEGGAQLAQIVDDGAIFSFDGAQVLFPVR